MIVNFCVCVCVSLLNDVTSLSHQFIFSSSSPTEKKSKVATEAIKKGKVRRSGQFNHRRTG